MTKRLVYCVAAIVLLFVQATHAQSPKDILDVSGIQGGLIVHLGCGNGERTASLRISDSHLVHGLDTDPNQVTLVIENFKNQILKPERR